ncbi:DsbA family protein [Roseibium sp.]|uniref:DsbA family protein n=1 Tax=Roseibium sp. TaxID=1936156 RepID=UPI003A982F5D
MSDFLPLIPRNFKATLTATAFTVGLFTASVAPSSAEELNREQVETIVKEYLLNNPEVIRDAMSELERREQLAEQEARESALTDSADALFNSKHQVVLGNPQGDVTLVEFFDYNCGYCKRAYSDMARLIEEDSNLRVVLKEFPVLGQGSAEAAQIAVAVNELAPEKYADFHQALLLQRGQANHASALKAATDLGLSEEDIGKVVTGPIPRATIEEVYGLADRLGLTGTPSYVVGNQVVPGAIGYDALKTQIAEMRN